MKVYEIAAVIDKGDYFEVEYITSNLVENFVSNGRFLKLNSLTAELIKEGLNNERNIRIVKDYQDVEIHPYDIVVSEDIDSELDKYKKIYMRKARQNVTHQQANVSGIMLYEYTVINNYLCDKGYFIHDENREEKYLEILETGDEILIDKLEIYLNAKDYIGRASTLEHKYFELYRELNNAIDKNQVDNIYKTFMKMFYDFQK